MQKQFTYRQYILTDLSRKTMCIIHIHILSTHSVLFKTYLQLSIHCRAAETSPWGQQREQTVGRVAGVLDDPPGFPYIPPGVDVLEGGKLTSNNVAGSSHDPLQSFAVASGAVSKPGGDAAGQDAGPSTPQCRSRRTWGFWGSFQTSSTVLGRRGAGVPSSALHMCEQTMWDSRWCERRGT